MRFKLRWIDLIVISGFLAMLVGLLMFGNDFDQAHRYPTAVSVPNVLPGEIDGEYFQGNGRATNLRLSILPDGRYSIIDSGCVGVMARESGRVRWSQGRYVLSPSGPIIPEVERALIPIEWGRRRYLIPTDKAQEFRDAIVAGEEPRDEIRGRFYIRIPIEPASGSPDFQLLPALQLEQ